MQPKPGQGRGGEDGGGVAPKESELLPVTGSGKRSWRADAQSIWKEEPNLGHHRHLVGHHGYDLISAPSQPYAKLALNKI